MYAPPAATHAALGDRKYKDYCKARLLDGLTAYQFTLDCEVTPPFGNDSVQTIEKESMMLSAAINKKNARMHR